MEIFVHDQVSGRRLWRNICGIKTGIGHRRYKMKLSEFRNILATILKMCVETEYSRDAELAAGQVVVCGPRPHL